MFQSILQRRRLAALVRQGVARKSGAGQILFAVLIQQGVFDLMFATTPSLHERAISKRTGLTT